MAFSTCRDRAIAIPTGMPITMARRVQTTIMDTVRIVSSHMPR